MTRPHVQHRQSSLAVGIDDCRIAMLIDEVGKERAHAVCRSESNSDEPIQRS